MRVIRQIEAANMGVQEINRLAQEAGDLAARDYRSVGFH